jgi:hypothetical protein
MTNKRYTYEKFYKPSNENDILHFSNNKFSLENENNDYSKMSFPTGMYYNNSQNNNQKSFDTVKKKLQDDIFKCLYQYNSSHNKLQEKYIGLTNKIINQQNKIDSQMQIINQLRYKVRNLEKEKEKEELDIENDNPLQKNVNLEIIQQNDS